MSPTATPWCWTARRRSGTTAYPPSHSVPDGSRFAYVANDSILVIDGEESEIGESTADQIAFSPDGSRVAYVRGDRKSGRVVLDEKEQKRHAFGCAEDLLPWGCMTFNSDGSEEVVSFV